MVCITDLGKKSNITLSAVIEPQAHATRHDTYQFLQRIKLFILLNVTARRPTSTMIDQGSVRTAQCTYVVVAPSFTLH